MGINVARVTESGEKEQQVLDPQQCLTHLATSRWHKMTDTKCLQFVETWGDAVFNQSQVPHLLQELKAELELATDPKIADHLHEVCELVERSVDQTHVYIKFIGD
jgi:hypothetical protein